MPLPFVALALALLAAITVGGDAARAQTTCAACVTQKMGRWCAPLQQCLRPSMACHKECGTCADDALQCSALSVCLNCVTVREGAYCAPLCNANQPCRACADGSKPRCSERECYGFINDTLARR